jgi:hypothetical protein
MDGVFGIRAGCMPRPNFSAHPAIWGKPFISETGYHSFIGLNAALTSNPTAETFVFAVPGAHISRNLSDRIVAIETRFHKK